MSARVLIAYDGSTAAEAAAATAGRLFARGHGRLLTIVDPPARCRERASAGLPARPAVIQQGVEELSRELHETGREIATRGGPA